MIRSVSLFLILSSLLVTNKSMATGDKGNGGDAIVCKSLFKKHVQLLDRYEGIHQGFDKSLKKGLGKSGESLESRVKYLIENYKKIDPIIGSLIEKEALALMSDLQFAHPRKRDQFIEGHKPKITQLTLEKLTEIDDSNEIMLPKKILCKKEQMVVNQLDIATDIKYKIRGDLWHLLPLNDKALTINHESIYDIFVNLLNPETDSRAISVDGFKEMYDSRVARALNIFMAQEKENIRACFQSLSQHKMQPNVTMDKNLDANLS
jgi:hypothetical protein